MLSPDYATVATKADAITLSAIPVGTVDPRGVFTVAGTGLFTRQFNLAQVDGEWRITDPPDGLIILEPDFERLYVTRDAFFIDPTSSGWCPIRGCSSRGGAADRARPAAAGRAVAATSRPGSATR